MKSTLIKVYGRVQGVGFRPFVYRIAKEHNLKGYVLNTSGAVKILLQGDEESKRRFLQDLLARRPPLALIDRVEEEELVSEPCGDFSIKESRPEDGFVFVSPDIAVCEECLAELQAYFREAIRRDESA